ncbi:phenylacetone monooxygenase [Sodiomyces alkalinus F11]|uniref:Phenylacetone monooxygenase n=1 Tax=Sodiomyces alkalinus (strain CBS 110278 / VKM F-3762 / F11) TaxID=1314773 RepID=A0A3N2PSC0_SODAK|nr:phenylacetone monooxygenase [Sodiomyces alkalinus F11]ROT37421.1 phenylacetone monooxygenase [Sodiomyces alkalinus F11]
MSPQALPNLSRHTDVSRNFASFISCRATDDGVYSIQEVPFGTPRYLRIITIGAGASGLNMIRTLRNTLPTSSFEHVVYEKNAEVGGTWFENRYPGCKCDVPSHNYQFSWRKNPEWSSFFAPAAEIEAYLCKLCDDECMRPSIKLSHTIVGARWSEATSRWQLKVHDHEMDVVFNDHADFLIDATGILNKYEQQKGGDETREPGHSPSQIHMADTACSVNSKWKWPDIPGVEDFEGTLIHTAAWPSSFSYKDKTVAVIGNGASGVQVLPAIRPHVRRLYHHIRAPTAIIPPRVATIRTGPSAHIIDGIELDENEKFTQAQIKRFISDPVFYEQFSRSLEPDSNGKFFISLLKDSPQQKWAASKVREFMTTMLKGDPVLCKAMIPDFPLGCRRLTPAPGYLESFHDPKVSLVTTPITRAVPNGIELADGNIIEVEAIICATGFDSSFRPAFPLVGRNGNLQDIWAQETPKSYMSLAIAGLPNYFSEFRVPHMILEDASHFPRLSFPEFLGPGAPIAHGDVFTLSEHIATYIANVILKAQTEGIRSIVPAQAAVDDYAAHVAAFMPRTAFSGACRSWYKQGTLGSKAPVIGLHPGSRMHFITMLWRFRGEDWEYTRVGEEQGIRGKANRFAYLGNGFTAEEMEMLTLATAAN